MQKMKKSKTKPRSQRSIDHEIERNRIIEEQEAKAARKARSTKAVGMTMICLYSVALAILAWLFDIMGIIALISVVLGIIGIVKTENRKGRDFYAAMAGTALGAVRLLTELIPLFNQLMN